MPILPVLAPIIGGIAQNVIQGINNRKARLYNSPAQQVRRLQEAGLPLAAGSQITGGVTTPTQATSLGTENFTQNYNNNLGASITRDIDRKKLAIMQQELISAEAKALIDSGNAKNLTNPSGQFTPTNQGTQMSATIGSLSEAHKAAQIANEFMPIEKAQSLLKGTKEIDNIVANTQKALMDQQIQVQDLAIKKIAAKYSEQMTKAELLNLTRRNTGLKYDNQIKQVAYNVEYSTQLAKITIARNAALQSGESLKAAQLGNILTNLSLPSTRAYYSIRREMDDATMRKPNLANTLLYLGMFQPNTSNYNLSNLMPNIPSSGNTYTTNNYIPKQ